MNTNGWQVLVVEDENDSIKMVSKILSHHGIQVYVANNGRECLTRLNELSPTLVVMDLAMPEMDGWETLHHMRANPVSAHIPVVAITAYHSANVANDAVQAGFDAYFPKPLDPKTFVTDLVEVVGVEPCIT
jgi:CheY-like chemotaxis protein